MHGLLSAAKNSTALRNSKTNVLPDMLSGCIEYQDLRSEKHTYKLAIGSKRIENPYTIFRQIFRCAQQHVQISRHISLVATYLSARNIRICDPKNIPINQKIGSNRIENPYTQFRQIANQPAH